MALHVGARHIAAVAVLVARDAGVELHGYMSEVAEALEQRKPLPIPVAPWSFDDVAETLDVITKAWPVRWAPRR